jgi:hypothetical protein
MSTCALCHNLRPLRNSHILPEFLYTPLYDSIHRFRKLSADPAADPQHLQKGLRERLLCQKCETTLSRVESYARKVLYGGVGISITKKGQYSYISGLDYTRLRIFLLSILWRAGVSRDEFFQNVSLGRHQERLRRMILNNDPGQPDQYGCIINAVTNKGKPISGFMVSPDWFPGDGQRIYRFVFGGFAWAFFVGNHRPSRDMCELFLTSSGTLPISFREFREIPWLTSLARDILGRA